MKKIIILKMLILWYSFVFSQEIINGKVSEIDHKNKIAGLHGATITWQGTTIGTTSDMDGNFRLNKIENNNVLIISHISYPTDTIEINDNQTAVSILLTGGKSLPEVLIKNSSGYLFSIKPISTHIITSDGFKKAACCNLAESFESSATVDVEYSDAVSGAKQIQMLGLAGVYSQILLENIPFIRGLLTPFGLTYVPGPWMESIYISKGTSSVINGYESITGQINVEYKKPESNEEKLFINGYTDLIGRTELNLNTRFDIKENVSTMALLHLENQFLEIDHNEDTFLDIPKNKQINFMNRWDYHKPNKMEGKAYISYLYEDKKGGQMSNSNQTELYKIGIKTNRFNATTKNGFFLKGEDESIGTQVSLNFHNNSSFYGKNKYNALQTSIYTNLIYANRIKGNKNHKINLGLSYQFDNYDEKLNDSIFSHTESVPGVFSQYIYSLDEKLALILGFRADYHSKYGLFLTPRAHLKYMLSKSWAIRGTIGKGYRTSNVYAENSSLLNTSRIIVVVDKIKNEEAWNYGINISKTFEMQKKDAIISFDYYRTEFINQLIIDLDKSSQIAYISNLHGVSYSNSSQIETILYPIKGLEAILAYRFNDVRQTTNNKLQTKPMVSTHKAVVSLSYKTKYDKWQFDFTTVYNGKMRLPELKENPIEYQIEKVSPDYFILNTQITRKFKMFDIYLGCENITDYKQKNPIIAWDDPFGKYFDSSIIWAPIKGRMIYGGFRFTVK